MTTIGRSWLRIRKLLFHRVLHADDSSHDIALGVAVAVVVAFLPLIGFQTAIAVGLAALCGANKIVGIPIVWITNPVTIIPIYGGCFALGRAVLSSSNLVIHADHLAQLKAVASGFDYFSLASWKGLFDALAGLGMELWLGCLLVGLTLGVISYFVSLSAVNRYRERRRRRILRRNVARYQPQPESVKAELP